ncbi:MAG: redoxin domain-containing protein [Nitrosopumilus sp.]|nr:redoxin domain-containing protein [Nitrosopumilus sp.]CAI9830957.1 Alkyl hydroperoxide reductase [Nitrosopumilaceae archaeon]MDA7943807.1 redoxin domain-containing protein [Nitrosopumilus sp.]MDA7945015.1 redoxin domain-containing protein [Nitrosopumilus sp.]MDA7953200.1 redoxin domain-containing protein [Nitrosopumilus sp.]
MVEVGDRAPGFELPDTDLKMRSLSEFSGKKVVVAFIVAASSPVCETELCRFRDSWDDIAAAGAQVISISNDGPFANKAFAEKNGLKFPLLADYTSGTIRAYGVLMKDLLHIKDYNAAKRSVFVVDGGGTVTYKWVSDDPLVEPDYDAVRAAVSA